MYVFIKMFTAHWTSTLNVSDLSCLIIGSYIRLKNYCPTEKVINIYTPNTQKGL